MKTTTIRPNQQPKDLPAFETRGGDSRPRLLIMQTFPLSSRRVQKGYWVDSNFLSRLLAAESDAVFAGRLPRRRKWRIIDAEGFYTIPVSAFCDDLHVAADAARYAKRHGNFFAYMYGQVGCMYKTCELFELNYVGRYASLTCFVKERVRASDECLTFKDCIDYEDVARRLRDSASIIPVEHLDDAVHIFDMTITV